MGEFLEKLGGQLAERRAAQLLGPLLFWAGGGLAWVSRIGWNCAVQRLAVLTTDEKVALTVVELLVLAISATLAQRFAQPVLRLLEGFWHPWVDPLRRTLTGRFARRLARLDQRFQELVTILEIRPLSAPEHEEYVQVDSQLRSAPVLPNDLLPTRLGNIIRGAEGRPFSKYGLEATVCWPRLWLLLPEAAKKDLGESREVLDSIAVAWLWSVLFFVWTFWIHWAAIVAAAGAMLAYYWMLDAAQVYGDLLESVFDVYRGELYKALRWELPMDGEREREEGKRLTQYLWRGFIADRDR